jgi:NAD(P)-dependent dehydrogenase (short-subunit alcohol dehydrogenase family)
LTTGANRGIGRALVEESLGRGPKRVYAGARRFSGLSDERVTPLIWTSLTVGKFMKLP